MSKRPTSSVTITIHDAPDMTKEATKEIAKWMRRHASFLEKQPRDLAKRFTARYMYRPTDYNKAL